MNGSAKALARGLDLDHRLGQSISGIEAMALQRPLPDDALMIVARGATKRTRLQHRPHRKEKLMCDKGVELVIEVPAETSLAIERAAAARGISVPEFVQDALRKLLVATGYADKKPIY